jgi:hypothetical protein
MNRLVWIDPDGFVDHDWMAVIVRATTGISFRHQYSGTACRHGTVEGYLVPVFFRAAYSRLRTLFEETLHGSGTWNWTWPEDLLAELRVTVGMIGMPPSTCTDVAKRRSPSSLTKPAWTNWTKPGCPWFAPTGPQC